MIAQFYYWYNNNIDHEISKLFRFLLSFLYDYFTIKLNLK